MATVAKKSLNVLWIFFLQHLVPLLYLILTDKMFWDAFWFWSKHSGKLNVAPIIRSKDIRDTKRKSNYDRSVRFKFKMIFKAVLFYQLHTFSFLTSHHQWKNVSLLLMSQGNPSVQISCNGILHLSPSFSTSRRKYKQHMSFMPAFRPQKVL